MDNYAALRDAVLGSQNIQASASPLGASNAPEIASLYRSSYQLPVASAASSVNSAGTDTTVENNKIAAANAARAAAARAAAAAANSGGGSSGGSKIAASGKYQVVRRNDGGFGFYAPDGSEISAYDYAKATNKDPAAVLKNSNNPIDKGFIQDWKNLNNYINNKVNSKGNSQAAQKAQAVEQQVQKLYGINLGKMQIQDVTNTFMQAYPTVFGLTNTGVPAGQTFIQSPNAQKKSKTTFNTGSSNRIGF